ncbi:hypothetical protein GCM10020331_056040 [Ectobacillus funiculus]
MKKQKKQGIDVSQVWSLEGKRTDTYTALLDYDGKKWLSLLQTWKFKRMLPQV